MTIRLAICQPGLPAYRLPVFERLATMPDVRLSLLVEGPKSGVDGSPYFETLAELPRLVPLSKGSLFYRPDFYAAVERGRYDLAILPWNARYVNLLPAVNRAHRHGVPVVLWGHGYSKHPRSYADWTRNYIGKRASAVLVYSSTVARHLVERHHFDPARVFVAQNALDQVPIQRARRRWLEAPENLAAFQREHGLDPHQTIIFVSRLLDENRVDLLIEGFRILHAKRPESKLVIVGSGPEEARLKSMAAGAGIDESVLFVGAIFDDNALAPWMLSSALFAYPVNIGLSLLHGFGYGLPVVTSDDLTSHNPEVEALTPGKNGLLYRHGDIEDMVAQWLRLLDDPTARSAMSRHAHYTATSVYTVEAMLQGFVDVLGLARTTTRTCDSQPHAAL